MSVDPADQLVAAVLSTGIWLNVIDGEAAVLWADHVIEKTEKPPIWVIDLSLSQNLHVVDVMKLLDQIGNGVVPVEVCREVYEFLPSPEGYSFDQADALAKQAYQIARHCLDGDWKHQLLCDADQMDDTFVLVRDGTFDMPKTQVVEKLWGFLDANRRCSIRVFLERLKRISQGPGASS